MSTSTAALKVRALPRSLSLTLIRGIDITLHPFLPRNGDELVSADSVLFPVSEAIPSVESLGQLSSQAKNRLDQSGGSDDSSFASTSVSSCPSSGTLPLDEIGRLIIEDITDEVAAANGLPSPPKKRQVPRGGKRRSAQLRRQSADDLKKYQEQLVTSGGKPFIFASWRRH